MNGHDFLSVPRRGRQYRASMATPITIWRPPFQNSPNLAVRRAWHEFTRYKAGNPYTVTEAIVFMSRLMSHTYAGESSDAAYGPLGPGLTAFMRRLRS
jgi:hypothetical protein